MNFRPKWRNRVIGLAAVLAAAMLCRTARADEAQDRFDVAAGHYAQQRWLLATEGFQLFLAVYPNHPKAEEALFCLGEAQLQLGRPDQAADRFGQYLARFPEGRFARPALFRAAEIAYLAHKFDRAKPQLEEFAREYPDDELNAHVLVYLGDVALLEQDARLAEQSFRQALTRFPEGPRQDECRLGLARALEKLGRAEEAERYYLAVSGKTASPLAAQARYHLGALEYSLGKYAQAIEAFAPFESQLAESPLAPTARLGIGWSLLKLGRLAEAKECFLRLSGDAKLGTEARYWLGITQKAEKDWAGAARTLSQAAQADPESPLAPAVQFHAGDAARLAGNAAAARSLFDQVLATAAENEWADDAVRGKVQIDLRQHDHAALDRDVAEFSRRFPQSPLAADVQRMLARSLLDRRQYQRAAEVLEPLARGPGDDRQRLESCYLLALAYQGLDRYQEALDALAPVLQSAAGPALSDARLVEIALLMSMKRWTEAVPLIEQLLASQPPEDVLVGARGDLAVCYARTGRGDQAKKIYAELLAKYPQHELMPRLTGLLGEAALDAGDTEWSAQLFARVSAAKGPAEDEVPALSGLAWSQYKVGRLEEAAETFGRVLQNNPDMAVGAEAALVRGRILQELGRNESALAMYDEVIQKYPDKDRLPEALWAAARLRDTLKQPQQAAPLYQRLAVEHPQFKLIDSALYQWAWCLDDLGRRDESIALFDRLRKEHPQSPYAADATFRLAQRAFEAKQYAKARELAAEALAAHPPATVLENTLYLQGQLAAAESKWDEAQQTFQSLLKDHPQSPLRLMAEYGLAEAVFRQGRFDEAARRFAELAQDAEGRRDTWMAVIPMRLAQSLCEQQKWQEACAVASRVEKEYPGFEEQYEVDYVLGRCLAMQADFEGARAAYRKVIRSRDGYKTETAAKAQMMIGDSYYYQKDYAAALREYYAVETLYAYPEDRAAALFQAARCHELLGEPNEAAKLYDRIVKVYPNTRYAKEAGRRLEEARKRASRPGP